MDQQTRIIVRKEKNRKIAWRVYLVYLDNGKSQKSLPSGKEEDTKELC